MVVRGLRATNQRHDDGEIIPPERPRDPYPGVDPQEDEDEDQGLAHGR